MYFTADALVTSAVDGTRLAHSFQVSIGGPRATFVSATRTAPAPADDPMGDAGAKGSGDESAAAQEDGAAAEESKGEGGSVFAEFYRDCLCSGPKKSWKRFLLELVSQFKITKADGPAASRARRTNLVQLAYAAELLATLPYQQLEEPLFVVFHANRLLALDGSQLMDALRDGLSAAGEDVGGSADATGASAEQEAAAGGAGPGSSTAPTLAVLRSQCEASIALTMLLQAKHYIKMVYQLDDEKCAAFEPAGSSSAAGPKGYGPARPSSSSYADTDAGPISLKSVCRRNFGAMGTRELADHYELFRKLMVEEPADVGTAPIASKRKSQSSSSSKARKKTKAVRPELPVPTVTREAGA